MINLKRLLTASAILVTILYVVCFVLVAIFPAIRTNFMLYGLHTQTSLGEDIMTIGTFLVIIGWITFNQNVKNNRLVTTGIYSLSRHPQYLGFILVIIGWLIGWPTLITLVFTPILIYKYIQVCQIEESEISNRIQAYQQYKKDVPFFI